MAKVHMAADSSQVLPQDIEAYLQTAVEDQRGLLPPIRQNSGIFIMFITDHTASELPDLLFFHRLLHVFMVSKNNSKSSGNRFRKVLNNN